MAYEAGSIITKFKTDVQGFRADIKAGKKELDGLTSKMQSVSQKMGNIGKNMSKYITVPVAGIAAAVTKFGADFDAAMTNSISIMGDLSTAMREDMEEVAKAVSKTTQFSATQAAESYFFLASAGLNAQQSLAALPEVAKFAQAGNFDMAQATDYLTDAQSALGLTVDDVAQNMENMNRVSDVLVKANTIANASVQQFSESLTNRAAAGMRNANIAIEEGVAVLAAFADQGIKGQLAGMMLDQSLRYMQDAALNNKEALREYNVEIFDAEGNMNNMADIIGDLEVSLSGMSDEQKAAALSQMGFNARTQSVIKTLMGTSDQIRKYQKDLENAGGITDEVAEKQLQNFWKQLGLIKNRVIAVGLDLWQVAEPIIMDTVVPAFETVVGWLESGVEWFGNLDPKLQKIILAFIAITAAIGPFLLIASKLLPIIVSLIKFVKLAGLAIGGLSAPVVGAVAAITAFAALAFETYRNWDEAKAAIIAAFELVVSSANYLKANASLAFEKLKLNIFKVINDILDKLSLLEKIPLGVGDKFKGLKDNVSDNTKNIAANISRLEEEAAKSGAKISDAWDKTKGAFSDFGIAIKEDVMGIVNMFKGQTEAVEGEELKQEEIIKNSGEDILNWLNSFEEEQTKKTEEGTKKRTELIKKMEEEVTGLLQNQSEIRLDNIEKKEAETIEVIRKKGEELELTEEEIEKEILKIKQYYADKKKELEEEQEKENNRIEFEKEWTEKLTQETETRLEALEREKEKALTKAEELEADKTAIKEYFALRRQEIIDEEQEAEDKATEEAEAREEERIARIKSFEEQWVDKVRQETSSRIELLKHEKQEALKQADELGASKLHIIRYYNLKIAEEEDRAAEEQEAIDEQKIKNREQLEQKWNDKLFNLTHSRLEILAKEKREAIAEAEEQGAETNAINEVYAIEALDIIKSQKIDTIQQLKDQKNKALDLAEELGIAKTEILEFYAQKEKEILDKQETVQEQHSGTMSMIIGTLKTNVIDYMTELKTNTEEASRDAASAIIGFVDSVASGQKTFKEALKDMLIAMITTLEQQVIAQEIAGIATAWAQAPATFGASLALIPQIISAVAPALATFEAIKALIRGLAEGAKVVGPTLAMVGEGKDEEAVLPLNTSVFDELASGIVRQLMQIKVSNIGIPQLAVAGSQGGALERVQNVSNKSDNRKTELNIYVGNYLGDEISLKKFARDLIPIVDAERKRMGGDE